MTRTLLHSAALGAIIAAAPIMATAQDAASYASPDEAVASLASALETAEVGPLLEVFGADAEDMVQSGEGPEDREDWADLLSLIQGGHAFEEQEDGSLVLSLGDDDWPFAVPLAKNDDGSWSFDTEAGRDEVFARRIGMNELDTIEILEGYVDVQAEFRLVDHDSDGVMEFAMHILSSSPEARDGLYWPGDDSPIGDFVASAAAEGYEIDGEAQEPQPYNGYLFRMLHAQGASAPGGAYDYVVNGNQVAGHALVAYPAIYGETGVSTFIVSEAGVVYEADLGEETADLAFDMTSFDPGEGWSPVEE
ncbi:DUF2950 domain-containing protein [Halovulum sp. GXIMD14794]